MQVTSDQWSPLFKSLRDKLSSSGRVTLLSNIMEDVKTLTLANFGEMADGPMRPWYDEGLVSEDYKRTIKRDFASLRMDESERSLAQGTKWENSGPHMIDSFVVSVNENAGSITNLRDYADKHQFGLGVPYRPFYPVNRDGTELMPFMEIRIFQDLQKHFQA